MRTGRVLRNEQSILDAVAELAMELEARGYRLGGGDDDDPHAVLLAFTPPARTNPFQALLYGRTIDHGVGTLPVKTIGELAELPWPGRVVCHLHWIANVLAGAESEAEADDLVATFSDQLDAVQRQGHRLVWTAHNVLPHDARHLAHEIALRQALIAAADAVHVMTDDTVDLFRERAPIPEHKVFHVPHPTYAGAYPDHVSRAEARSELGVRPGEVVFLLFGSLQPYKGVEELLAAFERLASRDLDRPARLVIAGNAPDERFGSELRVWAAGRLDATVEIARVPIEDVQYYYRAADVAVLPYRQALNSGAAMLAVTFGVPVLVAARGGLAGLAAMPGVLSYQPDRQDLTDAMHAALTTDLAPLRRAIVEHRAALAPDRISDAFARRLLEMLGWSAQLRRSA